MDNFSTRLGLLSLLLVNNVNIFYARERIIQYTIESAELTDVLYGSPSSDWIDSFLDDGYVANDGEDNVFYLSSQPCELYYVKKVNRFVSKTGDNHILQGREPEVVTSWDFEETIGYCYVGKVPNTVPLYRHTSLETYNDNNQKLYIYNLNPTAPQGYGNTVKFCNAFNSDNVDDCPTDTTNPVTPGPTPAPTQGIKYSYNGKYVTIYDNVNKFTHVSAVFKCLQLADGPASIHSEEDQKEAVASIKREWLEVDHKYDCPFIAGKLNQEGEVVWDDGSDYDFEYFMTGEPKDSSVLINSQVLALNVGCGPAGEWFTNPEFAMKSSTIICNHNQEIL